MSGTEDYLDGLLNSISEKDLDTKKKTGSETMQTEEDIMNDMENDLLSKEAEDNFLEQFEKEFYDEITNNYIERFWIITNSKQ